MSNERSKTRKPHRSPRLQTATPPVAARKWRQLVRIRNGIATLFLVTLGSAFVTLALIGIFPTWIDAANLEDLRSMAYLLHNPFLILLVCALGIGTAGLCFHVHLENHLKQTFRRNDITDMGCWIETLSTLRWTAAYWNSDNIDAVMLITAQARAQLLEHLPRLTADTAPLLNARERYALYKMLHGKDAELIPALLHAIPLLSEARALPFLRHLAEGKGPAAENQPLQAQATAALHQLQANLALQRTSHVLLRASQPPETPTQELLLSTYAHPEIDPTELLRAQNRP